MTHSVLQPGARVGPYEVVEYIGHGGMGVVYRGHDATLHRNVALKILQTRILQDEAFTERFHREARLWARLEHPCVVPLYFAGIEGGFPFLAMRFIDGGTLEARLKSGPVPFGEALVILGHIARALDFAHSQGVIHRDVKPANVLLEDGPRAYLSDFGIARSVAVTRSPAVTQEVVGTPNYMAPEQARSQTPTPLVDIYSLGCLAYEALTGLPPFRGNNPLEVMMRHITESPMPPRALTPALSPAVDSAVMKALAKEPGERWPSATLFVQALLGEIDIDSVHTVSIHGQAPEPVTAAPSTPPPVRRSSWRAWVGLALALGLCVTGLFKYHEWQLRRAAEASALSRQAQANIDRTLESTRALRDKGDYPAALSLIDHALRIDPENAAAIALRERVRRAWEAEKALGTWSETRDTAATHHAPD
jgi:serine/threonine protein kinase